ncbi:RNA polymerase sigma-70 factor [Sphingobacterium multivorum]|uniref:RNA polymerase sigma-70 factor n=1 Tax=Sphingobacterium multivorum TaxID=28454 RepID=UPI0028AC5402|nr:RNA polymerase sigma-70 factor [Sphingobacterium multivorum]
MQKLNQDPFLWTELRYAIVFDRSQLAFKTLFKKFYPDLYDFGHAIIKSPGPVEDIISEIFMKLWLMEDKLMEIENIKTYLFRSVRNNAIKYLERQHTHVDISEIIDFNYQYPSVEQEYISSENLKIIQQIIDELPSKCKMAFTLVKELGFTYHETAAIMEISTNTVDRHIQLALRRLRDSITCRKINS